MNQPVRFLLCLSAGVVLCQCSSTQKTKSKSELSLQERTIAKPDVNTRSSFEKYMTDPKGTKGGSGAYFQKQMHHSKEFNGGNSYAGQKQFKANQSRFGKSQAQGMDMTYALGDKQASAAGNAFKTNKSRFGDMQSREGGAAFRGANDAFKTGSALTRAKGTPKAPLIIENIEATSTKKSAYSEDEVKKLLGR